jgi:chromosome segregation ATPase
VAIWNDLKAVALALHRLSESEKKLAELAAENKAAIKELRATMQELRERQIKIETRLESLDEVVTTKAQATAAMAVAQALAPMMERLARLEVRGGGEGGPPRLSPPQE